MNLLDFEKHIDGIILARGWEYYRGDCVKSVEKKDKNNYTAVVAGTYDYKVTIKALEEQKGYRDNYPSILIEEREQKKLLDYVKARPAYITRYHRHLLPAFRDEVDHLFTQYILGEAQRAGNRNAYREICSLIRQFANTGAAEKARQVASQLLATYPRKPAFREELLKVKF